LTIWECKEGFRSLSVAGILQVGNTYLIKVWLLIDRSTNLFVKLTVQTPTRTG